MTCLETIFTRKNIKNAKGIQYYDLWHFKLYPFLINPEAMQGKMLRM